MAPAWRGPGTRPAWSDSSGRGPIWRWRARQGMRRPGTLPRHRPAPTMTRVRPFAACPLVLSLLSACGGGGDGPTTPPATPRVRTVVVSPDAATLDAGTTRLLNAAVSADAGADIRVSWSSLDAPRATVDSTGLVTAVAQDRSTGEVRDTHPRRAHGTQRQREAAGPGLGSARGRRLAGRGCLRPCGAAWGRGATARGRSARGRGGRTGRHDPDGTRQPLQTHVSHAHQWPTFRHARAGESISAGGMTSATLEPTIR